MTHMFQTTSRAAMIALFAAAPLSLAAQTATEQPAEGQVVQSEGTTTTDGQMQTSQSGEMAAEGEAATTEGEAIATDGEATATEGELITTEGNAATTEGEMTTTEGNMATTEGEMNTDSNVTIVEGDNATQSTENMEIVEGDANAAPVEGQIIMQDEDSILAGNLMGATIYNGADESVGDVNDLIIALGGNVEGVVIGVGGFLGIGEKHVAVEMSSLQLINDESGNPRLVTSATKEDLEAAPEFVSAERQQTELQNAPVSGGGMGGTTTAPVE